MLLFPYIPFKQMLSLSLMKYIKIVGKTLEQVAPHVTPSYFQLCSGACFI